MIDREMSQLQAEYEADQFTLCPPSLDFPSILCHTNSMTYTRDQLITALAAEYSFLCHDDFDPDVDMTDTEHLAYLNSLTVEQLIDETTTDDEYTLDDFMRCYA
jgi:hypothetical protein